MLGQGRVGWTAALLAVDAVAVVAAFVAAYGLRTLGALLFGRETTPLAWNLALLGVILPLWPLLVALHGGYGLRWLDRSPLHLAGRVTSLGLGFLLVLQFLVREPLIYRGHLLAFAATAGAGLALGRHGVRRWLRYRRRDARWLRHALVVGAPEAARRVVEALIRYPETGWTVVGWVRLDGRVADTPLRGIPCRGVLEDVPRLLQDEVVDEVFFAVPTERLDELAEALQACEHLGAEARVLVDLYRPARARAFVEELFGLPFYGFSPRLGQQGALALKRALDVAGAGLLLLLSAPLLLALAALVRATSPGPAIFRQERAGLRGRHFTIYKLRTMIAGAEALQAQLAPEAGTPIFKLQDDPRVTPLGRWLRRLSLDELPQLWNVLRGDMSLVGPRPLPLYEASRIKGAQRRRFAMRPGLTGLWQVSGRSQLDFGEWMRLDLEYVDRWSLGLDLRILARTVGAVLRGRGAY